MKIPRNLKPGDVIVFSDKKRYPFVSYDMADKTGPQVQTVGYWAYLDGTVPPFKDTYAVSIERIASAPAKVKRAKVDKDAAWLRRFTVNVWPYEARRIRAIARRLEGGKP